MKWILTSALLAAMACAMPATVSAKSKFYNATGGRVEAAWTAFGCGGVKPRCGGNQGDVAVCKKKSLMPGESSSYSFKDGTTLRDVAGTQCSTGYTDGETTSNGGKSGRCAAVIRTNSVFAVKCGYSAKEYEELKNQPLQQPPRSVGRPR